MAVTTVNIVTGSSKVNFLKICLLS